MSVKVEKAVVPYELKPRETAAVEAWRERRQARAPSPRIKVRKKGNGLDIDLDHPHPATASALAMGAVGTTNPDFLHGLLQQLVNAGSHGKEANEDGINFMLSVVNGIEPQDELEAMLASQMAAVHMASMTFARRLAHVDTIPQQDSAERAFNKLARTFATQMEALKRYRTGGQQKMIVEHVTVQEGGQAIIGNVHGRGAPSKNVELTS